MTQLSSQIKEKIRSFSERYASLLSEETLPDPLLPQKQHMRKQEIEAEEKKDLTAFVERIQMSLDEIASQSKNLSHFEPDLFTGEILDKIAELQSNTTVIQELALDSLVSENAESIKDTLAISNQLLQGIYRIGAANYDEGRFIEASAVFSLLTLLDPACHYGWICLGHSECKSARYKAAVAAYAMASYVEPNDPYSYLFSAYCYEKLLEKTHALDCLHIVVEIASSNPEYRKLAEEVSTYKNHLQSQEMK